MLYFSCLRNNSLSYNFDKYIISSLHISVVMLLENILT